VPFTAVGLGAAQGHPKLWDKWFKILHSRPLLELNFIKKLLALRQNRKGRQFCNTEAPQNHFHHHTELNYIYSLLTVLFFRFKMLTLCGYSMCHSQYV
jgi:hypothetical protein